MQNEVNGSPTSAAEMGYCYLLIRKTRDLDKNTMPSLLSPILILVSLKAFRDMNSLINSLLLISQRKLQKEKNAFIRRNFFNLVITR